VKKFDQSTDATIAAAVRCQHGIACGSFSKKEDLSRSNYIAGGTAISHERGVTGGSSAALERHLSAMTARTAGGVQGEVGIAGTRNGVSMKAKKINISRLGVTCAAINDKCGVTGSRTIEEFYESALGV
jgi:hypothetical protein